MAERLNFDFLQHSETAAQQMIDVHILECLGHIFSMQKSLNRILDNVKGEYKQAK